METKLEIVVVSGFSVMCRVKLESKRRFVNPLAAIISCDTDQIRRKGIQGLEVIEGFQTTIIRSVNKNHLNV